MKQDNWRQLLEPIVRQAGEILLSYWGNSLKKTRKVRHGFVTEADIASEQFLITELSKILPEASFWAEESGRSGGHNDYCWVIDPLDGTTNFAYGLPYFCISVALTYKNEPIIGIVFQPFLDEFFYAEKGKGAQFNDHKITVTKPENFRACLIAIGLPYEHKQRGQIIDFAKKIASKARGVRHFGAIALDLAYIASGRMDGAVFAHLAWWDVAAGIVLIQEAGGIITEFDGNALTPDYRTCISGGKLVYESLKTILTR